MSQSTSSSGDSHAKTSAPQDEGKELEASVRVFGSSSLGLLGSYDPATSSLRTAPSSKHADSTPFLDRLPRSGMMRNGIVYQLEPSAPLTKGTASGLLPTPTAHIVKETGAPSEMKRKSPGLGTLARTGNLGEAMEKLPWPTPNARDYKGPPGRGSQARGGRQSSLPAKVRDRSGPGPLNPTWLEWLMNFPLGWTELK